MLGDGLFLPRLGCAVTTVNPSCRFTKRAKGICLGFQDTRHPDLHSSSDRAFCHSEVPEKRLMRVCGLPAQCVFGKRAGSGMCLTSEAHAGHLHTASSLPCTPCTGLHQTPTRTRVPSLLSANAWAHQTTRTMLTNSLWHVAKAWPRSPCPQAGQCILPIHPMPLLFLQSQPSAVQN